MKIYMTGGTGMVGGNILRAAVERRGATVFTTVQKWRPQRSVPFLWSPVDMLDRDQVLKSVMMFKPDAIIHSAILKGLEAMYHRRKLAWNSYVDATRNLTEAACAVGAKMILISTDWVFDGTQGPADETTPPNPINYYGVMKVVCENLLPVMTRNWAVARVAGVNGLHQTRPEMRFQQDPGFGNLMMAVVERLRQGLPSVVWDGNVNQLATPSLATEIGEMVMRIIEKDLSGVFHCCGGEGICRLELVYATAEGFGLDRALIRQELIQTEPNRCPNP